MTITATAARPDAPAPRTAVHLVAVLTLLLVSFGMLPSAAQAATSPTGAVAAPWPASFDAYTTIDGNAIGDTNGDISPSYNDLASGPCSGCVGPDPSVALTSDGTNAFFRMRLATNIADNTKGGLVNGAFLTQIAVGGVVKAVVGVDGKDSAADYVYVTNAVGGAVTKIYTYPFDASGGQTSAGMRVVDANDGTGQAFLDFQVPIAALTTVSGGAIKGDTPVKLYYGSSAAANLATINKDFMLGSANTVDFSTLSTVTLAPLTVTFDTNGGSAAPAAQSVAYNGLATAPADPTRSGLIFKGWYTLAAGGTKWPFATKPVTGNVTLFAQYAAPVTVTFDADGGDYTPPAQTFASGTSTTAPAQSPARSNYLLKGWYAAKGQGGTKIDFATATFSADTTLYAQWFKASNLLSFDSLGGSPVPSQVIATTGGGNTLATKPSPDPTRTGDLFYAWATAPTGGTVFDFATFHVSNDMTLYALYYPKTTFDSAGGTPVPNLFYTNFANTQETPPTPPTRTGYTFKDWVVTGTTFVWSFNRATLKDIPLTAEWVADARITFDTDGGTPVPDVFVVAGANAGGAPSPEPTKAGYTFDSWYTAPTGGLHFDFYNRYAGGDATAYARWFANSYTLSFDSAGGTPVTATTVTFGQPTSAPADPTRSGYTFTGWNTAVTGGTAWDFTSPYGNATDTTLYAQWTGVTHTVTFRTNGGTAVASQTVDDGGLITRPADPTRFGYALVGWSVDQSGLVPWSFGTGKVTGDLDLYAVWELAPAVFTFDSAGGTAVDPETVPLGQLVPRPADPTRDGYTFDGWTFTTIFRDAFWQFDTLTASGNTTLYAQWTKIPTSIVTFDAAGGTPTPQAQTVLNNGHATEPTPPNRDGYTFGGWDYFGGTWDFANSYVIYTNLTLTAHWTPVPPTTYTVSFDADGGTATDPQTITDGDPVTQPADPTRDGYTFAGWTLDPAGVVPWDFVVGTVSGATTLYAQWTPVPPSTYTVSFDADGGTATDPQTITDGDPVTQPADPTRDGYTFAGWFTTGGTAWDFTTDAITGDTTLVAHWTPVPPTTYTVSFDADGGTATDPQTITDGDPVTQPTDPTRDGYTFAGWTLDPAGVVPWDFVVGTVSGATTLYAQWTPVPPTTYTVSFDADGGTATDPQTITDGDPVTQPADPTRDGYTFAGWFTTGDAAWDFTTDAITGDTTLVAHWTVVPPSTYTVSFDADGGTATDPQTITDGDLVSQPADPTRDGYTFAGWFTTSGEPWDFGSPVTSQLTLVARWQVLPPTTNGGGTHHSPSPHPQAAPAAPSEGAHQTLPETGASYPIGMLPLGGLLVLLGAVLVRRSRRRA